MSDFPETISELEAELRVYLTKEDRKDPEFRHAIAMSQVGPLVSHLTHDPALNPAARPHGTLYGERLDFGHALLQMMIYGVSRNLPIQGSIDTALIALRTRDWRTREAGQGVDILGLMAAPGVCEGSAWVDPHCEHLHDMPQGSVLIAIHPTCEATPFLHKCIGIITDQGGAACHAAILARERDIPCIVGTGNATQRVRTGQNVKIKEIRFDTGVLELRGP